MTVCGILYRYMRFFAAENATAIPVFTTAQSTNSSKYSAVGRKPILFEKSATYFDNEAVPRRSHALLPRAKLVNCSRTRLISLFI